ncbi:hypothetical protein KIN20_036771 [Parelaphostrongylus tenuis]|uniref:Uncharacterized protein n=1 Tax=Parelaphostrongylus tenuis TaxID=148309 RepID=A0AAD5WKP4_PARTN|nr:hypothetical protein KIN20_036771 [Parelaphostrongylus tenuis]
MEDSMSFSSKSRKNSKRVNSAVKRLYRLNSSVTPWLIASIILTLEVFSFESFIGRFFLGDCLPCLVVVSLEYILLVYVISIILWMMYECFSKSAHGFVRATFGMILPSPSNTNPKICSSFHLPDMSNRSDTSWVDDHHFGTPTEGNSAFPRQVYNSPSHSDHHLNVSSGNIMESSFDGITNNVVMPRGSPYNKSIDSIHTREQLDYLLSKEGSSPMDTSASRNNSFAYFNVLDIGAPDEIKSYRVSEQLKSSDPKENIVVKMGPGNRVILSPATSDGDGQDEMTSSCLREIDFVRGEQRLRAWIVNTILEPLDRRIKKTNSKLEKEHSSPPLRIGTSSVETLQTALVSRPELLDTMLPYIIPFLSVHSNQSYLVGRISELASDMFMMEYVWNGGGKEPVQEKVATSCRAARRPWGEHLPTDAMLVFSLFSAYMDTQLTSNPLVGTYRLAQPFSALYTLKAPQRPTAVHLAAESFYLHMSTISPPHVDFVFNDADGSPSRPAIPRGARNLFSAILSFISHAKANNGGRLDRMSIGPTGLNIACILE